MSDIGATLREAREERGLSLAEAEAGTRIRVRFLEALENNQFDELPGELYLRGFLRNYASFLGLDPARLLAELGPSETQIRFPLPSRSSGPRFLSEPLQPSPFPLGRILFTLGVLALLGVLAFSLWWQPTQRDELLARFGVTLPQFGANATVTVTVPEAMFEETETAGGAFTQTDLLTQTTVVEPVPVTEEERNATPVPTATLPPRTPTVDPNATATAMPTATPEPQQDIILTAQVLERTWAEVYVDSQEEPLVYRILETGENLEWTAEQELYLYVGNAGGISLTLNGEELGILGASGDLAERRWQRNPDGGPPLLVEPQG
ncbi:MAG: DUF4115 domain-containing protein [Chloroflexota bacterium]|nr:DUF4115 domain-containing protein [Chloroflexota bacterium]